MSTNLVSDITQNLNANLVSRVASAFGIDGAQVESAMSGGIPAVLATLTSLASTPKGAATLSAAVAQQQPGLLSSLTGMIGDAGQKSIIDAGRNTLTNLIGGSTMSAVAGAIGKYAGINEGVSKSIVALLAPIVLGGLGQQQRASGLDASGLANLLTSQKDNILRAIPPGLSRSLSGTGILDSLADSSARVANASRDYEQSKYGTPATANWATSGSSSSSRSGWLLPALAGLAFLGLAWHFLSRPESTQTAQIAPPAKVEVPVTTGALPDQAAPSFASLENLRGIKAGDVDVGAQAADAVTKLRASLEKITDEASAKTAMVPLQDSAAQLSKITGMLNQLSPTNRAIVAKAIAAIRPSLNQLFDKALQIPAVAALIKPSIDSIRSEMDTLATA
jgi:hypothetical protein